MGAAFLIHVSVSVFTAIIMGLFTGRINFAVSVLSLGAGAVTGIWFYLRTKGKERLFPDISFVQALLYGFIIYAGLQHFLYLLYNDRNIIRTLHVNNFGDLTMHIQYISSMAGGARFWPENPGFSGELLRYPIGMDLYNSLWESSGVPLESHLFLTGIAMTVIAVSMLHRWMGWLGPGAFFLNGGLANWRFIGEWHLKDYQNALAWKNFFLSLWITQRGFLFAVPAGVYVIKTITETLLEKRQPDKYEKTALAVLWSSLAVFHLHTFFIISLALFISILAYRKIRVMLPVLIPVFIVGTVFVWFSTEGFSKTGLLHIQWGWVAGEENLLMFWIVNTGPWFLLGVAGLLSVIKGSFTNLRLMAVIFAGLFFIFTFVIVAPWDWDNIKVLFWLYLLIIWLAWKTFAKHLSPLTAVLAGIILFFPGIISITSSLPAYNKGTELYQTEALWEYKASMIYIGNDAVLAVSPEPNHPVAFLGHKTAMGYPGHLWTHGINYSEKEKELDRIFRGEGDWLETAHRMGITHICWSEREEKKYKAFNPEWQYKLKNISQSKKIKVFELPQKK